MKTVKKTLYFISGKCVILFISIIIVEILNLMSAATFNKAWIGATKDQQRLKVYVHKNSLISKTVHKHTCIQFSLYRAQSTCKFV